MIHNKFRYLLTLVALFAMTAGAWATDDNTVVWNNTTWAGWADSETTHTVGDITITCSGNAKAYENTIASGEPLAMVAGTTDAITFTSNGKPFSSIAIQVGYGNTDIAGWTYNSSTCTYDWSGTPSTSVTLSGCDIKADMITFTFAEPAIEVNPVAEPAANTQQWTFTQPGGDVVLTPLYAPTATWATTGSGSEVTLLAPAAAEGVIAGTDAPLIVDGTGIVAFAGTSTEVTQGTVMYAVTAATITEAPALTAFSATVPTAEDVADDGAEVKVWYYILGADTPDGEDATLDNTFNNSDVCATPLTVTVLSNKFDLTLKAANANTIDATPASKGSVSVKVGTAAAVDKTGDITDGKLKSIKMGSEVKLSTKAGYKFRKVEVKKAVVAEGHALTSAKFGEIVCSDGKAYAAADKDILPKGVKAEALVCYVDGEHGLALAMVDVKNEKMSWDNERGANDGKTAAEWCDEWNTSHPITGATWLLASQTQWNNMINAAGSANINLSNAFSAVGGTNLQAWSYWSSTPHHGGTAAYKYYFPSSAWQWTYLNQDNTGSYIRACLEW